MTENKRLFGLWSRIKAIFGKNPTETRLESKIEEIWDNSYRDASQINFCEIFANRLTNYTLDGACATVDDEEINKCLQRAMETAPKWEQMAYGIGRVYLIPYIMNKHIYTDIVAQSRVEIIEKAGNDPTSIAVLADTRTKDEKWYDRWTLYEFDENAHTFSITSKATERNGNGEVPLAIFDDWATIPPFVVISGVERPLYAVVDCPHDNREADMPQGASITFGCEQTIHEIRETLRQYANEYELKKTFVGVDSIMIDPNTGRVPDLFKTFEGHASENLFEIFSPDIRSQAYKDRLLFLFSMLEKQVGTSSGILTPADANVGTATQVKRGIYDTQSLVNKARASITSAMDSLCYAYDVLLSLLGVGHSSTYTIKCTFKDTMLTDETERFARMIQAEQAGAISKAELRREIYPDETVEEAQAAIEEIGKTKQIDFDPAMMVGV